MWQAEAPRKIFAYTEPTDMRKSFLGLLVLVQRVFKEQDPYSGSHFVFVNRDEPVEGEWVPFKLDVREDFQELWGRVPEDVEKLRLLFEVRWDSKQAGDGTPRADVYYDDLYVGDSR